MREGRIVKSCHGHGAGMVFHIHEARGDYKIIIIDFILQASTRCRRAISFHFSRCWIFLHFMSTWEILAYFQHFKRKRLDIDASIKPDLGSITMMNFISCFDLAMPIEYHIAIDYVNFLHSQQFIQIAALLYGHYSTHLSSICYW